MALMIVMECCDVGLWIDVKVEADADDDVKVQVVGVRHNMLVS